MLGCRAGARAATRSRLEMSAARPRVGLLIIGLGTSPAALDTSLNIALPDVTAAFAIALHSVQWVVISYMLTYGSLMLVCGRLGDAFGHRRVFQLGLAVTAFGLSACGLARGYGWLLGGRAMQGVGIALCLSCAPALATRLYPENVRARVLGTLGALFALFTALGPFIGGMLLERFGWSAVFWYRVPLVLTALALSWLLPEHRAHPGAPRFDTASAALLALTISGALLGGIGVQWDVRAAGVAALLALGALAALLRREARAAEPIVPIAALRDVGIGALHLAGICMHAASFAILLLVPYYLAQVADMPAARGGLLLSTAAVGAIGGSLAAGRLASLFGTRRIACVGVVGCAAGLAAVGSWLHATPPLGLSAALLLQGVGVGMFQVAYTDLVVATMPIAERGVAGSLAVVTRTIGVVGGAAGLSALFQWAQVRALAAGLPASEAFLAAFHVTFAWTWIGLSAVVFLTLVRPSLFVAER